jgi:hypothetical protein
MKAEFKQRILSVVHEFIGYGCFASAALIGIVGPFGAINKTLKGMKTLIMIFALTISTVCANPEGDKFRKSFDAYSRNYVGNSRCDIFNVDCNRSRLEILQIVADQARTYKATPEAAATLNGKLADAVIEDNDAEHAFYQRLANGQTSSISDRISELEKLKLTLSKIQALLDSERDEAFKRSIQ